MLDQNAKKELESLIGIEKLSIFNTLYNHIKDTYEVESKFKELKYVNKQWPANYEIKFTKGSKTFCGFYFGENRLGLLIIFGKEERTKVESLKNELSTKAYKIYDKEDIYHDGKWVMFELEDLSLVNDIQKLLTIKRKPNKLV